ncbi:hypothetical protein TEA_013952 [Camellia sinensis var. sinensis]|uniref:Uncharacterized protein n=1 Tax=Camellia sinensis var. sinensis TaxID=542762 RepID=A0A4S4DLM8_CAMSN|nr:hypothetical protein TEA_013952 [Camellia sinensis var. sinensis]
MDVSSPDVSSLLQYHLYASGTPCNQGGSGTTSKKRAREAEGIAKGLVDMAVEFGSFFKKTNTTMEEIAHRIGYAQDLSKARKLVNGELAKLRLNTNDRLRAATLIVKDAERVDLFFSLPKEEKMEWREIKGIFCGFSGLGLEEAKADSNRRRCSVLQWHPDVATQLIVASDDDSSPALSFSKYQKPIENYYIVWRF